MNTRCRWSVADDLWRQLRQQAKVTSVIYEGVLSKRHSQQGKGFFGYKAQPNSSSLSFRVRSGELTLSLLRRRQDGKHFFGYIRV